MRLNLFDSPDNHKIIRKSALMNLLYFKSEKRQLFDKCWNIRGKGGKKIFEPVDRNFHKTRKICVHELKKALSRQRTEL